MSSGPKRSFTVALVLALGVGSVACGSESESSSRDSALEPPDSPTTYSGTAQARASCTPSVALGDPVAAPLPYFACPSGWSSRSKSNALLVAGRFRRARELVDALCTESSDLASSGTMTDADGEPAGIGIDVDFDTSDVIAIASDGDVGLHRRAGELWVRHTETCSRSYRTTLFVVPKNATPLEQTCSAVCD